MELREEYDDPIQALVAGFYKFGFDDETIRRSDRYTEVSGSDYETTEAYIRGHLDVMRPHPDDGYTNEELWEKLPQKAYTFFPASFRLDWKWQTFKVAIYAEWGLEHYGYETDVEFITDENATSEYPSISTTHPESFLIIFRDSETNETLDRVPFRPPPAETERKAVLNHEATAAALNQTVLHDRDVEIVQLVGFPGDHTKFAVVRQNRLDQLESQFGEGCPVFGKELVNRNLGTDALERYEPENARPHRDEFGISEPENTFKLGAHQ